MTLTDAAIVIRSTNERTEAFCYQILSQQVPSEHIEIIHEYPFVQALAKSFEVGLEFGLPWTVCIDADILLRFDAVSTLTKAIQNANMQTFEVQAKVLDKFFGGPMAAGNHCYRTVLLEKARQYIPFNYQTLRPETFVIKEMAKAGYPWLQLETVIGLHDYKQYYRDIIRKLFVRKNKHAPYIPVLEKLYQRLANQDEDYRVGLMGTQSDFNIIQEELLDVRKYGKWIETLLQKQNIAEKAPLNLTQFTGFVETTLNNYTPPPEFYEVQSLIKQRSTLSPVQAQTMFSLNWLESLTDSIWEWLLSIRDEKHPGYFHYSKSGSKLIPSAKTGLGVSSLALKIAYQINCLDQLPVGELTQWTDHIRSFQHWPWWGRFAGFFEDKAITNVLDQLKGQPDIEVRRAETRQASAALLGAGTGPRWPIRAIPHTREQVVQYIDSLPWHLPWSAGSHTSHLVFFLKLNAERFNKHVALQELIPLVWTKLDELQDKESGTWFRGETSPEQKVNGAMKVLTAYALLNKNFAFPERLIDFCLAQNNDQDACHNVDIMYVLYQCSRWTDHRRGEIEDFAARRVEIIRSHHKPDGAFSFFPEQTGTHYYGVEVAASRNESDVHGTHLLVWGLTMAGEILGFNEILRWQPPIT